MPCQAPRHTRKPSPQTTALDHVHEHATQHMPQSSPQLHAKDTGIKAEAQAQGRGPGVPARHRGSHNAVRSQQRGNSSSATAIHTRALHTRAHRQTHGASRRPTPRAARTPGRGTRAPTHPRTQPHPRTNTAHRGPAEAAPQECSAPGRGGPAASSRRSRVHIQRRSSGSGGVAGRRPVRRPGGTLSAISAEEARSVDSDQIDGCWLTIPAKKVIHPETARLSNTGGGR
jgi:hypothetical protein